VTQATGEIEKLKRHPITILLYFLLVYDQVFIAKLVKLLPTLGTARMMPTIPHIHPQNVSESRMMTGFTSSLQTNRINP